MKSLLPILKFVVVALFVGYISMLLQREAMLDWYPLLEKSSLTPPGYVFSLVWGVLYILMGVSAGLLWSSRVYSTWVLMLLFFIQLLFNLLWSLCFFYLQQPLLAFIILIALLLTVSAYVAGSYRQRPVAAYINIPYLLWLLFATYLNGYVMVCN